MGPGRYRAESWFSVLGSELSPEINISSLANCRGGEVRDGRAGPAAHCDVLFPRLL